MLLCLLHHILLFYPGLDWLYLVLIFTLPLHGEEFCYTKGAITCFCKAILQNTCSVAYTSHSSRNIIFTAHVGVQ